MVREGRSALDESLATGESRPVEKEPGDEGIGATVSQDGSCTSRPRGSASTLVSGRLSGVVGAIRLSRATFRKIAQNLFWAFFYNVVMAPLAIVGWIHPVLAEIALATSSVSVVGNANRLRRVDVGLGEGDPARRAEATKSTSSAVATARTG